MPEDNIAQDTQPWKALGFDTFEAYAEDQATKNEAAVADATQPLTESLKKVQGMFDEGQIMIQRQANELGTLRKLPKEEIKPEVTPVIDKDNEKKDQETKAKLEATLSSLTEENVQAVTVAYDSLDAAGKALVKASDSGRLAFINQLLPDLSQVADGFFDQVPEQKLTIEEQVQAALNKAKGILPVKCGATGIPVATSHETVSQPIAQGTVRSGDLRQMLSAIEKNQK